MKTLKFYMEDSIKRGYSLGAYNFVNMEVLKGICEGCKISNSPCIVSVSEGALNYMGEYFVKALFESAKKEYNLPIFLHLDHGKSFEICKKAIDIGFDSVMIDGSALTFEENIKLSKLVCDYAHQKNVLVEAELGVLAGIEDNTFANQNIYTDPQSAKKFVNRTECDSLAIAIGTSHGAYKFKGEQTLRFDILNEIEKLLPNYPLVLHGASSVNQEDVDTINAFGGKIVGAKGIPEQLLKKASKEHNIFKINCDTDLRLAYIAMTRKYLAENPENIDIRKPNLMGIKEIAKVVANKNINVFNSENKI